MIQTQVLEERLVLSSHAVQVEDSIPGGGLNNAELGTDAIPYIEFNGMVYFSTLRSNSAGNRFWRAGTDGVARAVPLADSVTISQSMKVDSLYSFRNVGGKLFFIAKTSDKSPRYLWCINSEGEAEICSTASTWTSPVDVDWTQEPDSLIDVNGVLYFTAAAGNYGRQLFRISDHGVAEIVEDADPLIGIGPGSDSEMVDALTVVGTTLYFTCSDGIHGRSLWTIGTSGIAKCVQKKDNDGSASDSWSMVNPWGLRVLAGSLYFFTLGEDQPQRLWKVNNGGFAEGVATLGYPKLIDNRIPDVGQVIEVNGMIYCVFQHRSDGVEVARISPSGAVKIVEDKIPGGGIAPWSDSSSPGELVNLNGTLFFTADDGAHGRKLWRVRNNGLTAERVDFADPRSWNYSNSSVASLIVVNDKLIFRNDSYFSSDTLWRVTATGAPELITEAGSAAGIIPETMNWREYVVINGILYFTARNETSGRELWQVGSKGNASLVEMISGIGGVNPGPNASSPGHLTDLNGALYFSADDDVYGRQLYRLRTNATLQMIDDDVPGQGFAIQPKGSDPDNFINVGGTLYFTATDGSVGNELWRINVKGDPELVEDSVAGGGISPGSVGSYPSHLIESGGVLFFVASTADGKTDLWRVNAEGMAEIIDDGDPDRSIDIPQGPTFGPEIIDFNGVLYFQRRASEHSTELWRVTDTGKAEIVVDTATGESVTNGMWDYKTQHLTIVGKKLFFPAASERPYGLIKLWRINEDGTAALSIVSKEPSQYPDFHDHVDVHNLTNVNGTLYFATDKLWKLNNDGMPEIVAGATVDGTEQTRTEAHSPRYLTNVNGTLYFRAYNESGLELWRVNSSGIAEIVEDSVAGGGINPDGSSEPNSNYVPDPIKSLTVKEGKLYFYANDGQSGTQLWFINGRGFAQMVEDDVPGGGLQNNKGRLNPYDITIINDVTYLGYIYPVDWSRAGLWTIDANGIAKPVPQELPLSLNSLNLSKSSPSLPFLFNGRVYFHMHIRGQRDDWGQRVDELWRIGEDSVARNAQLDAADTEGAISSEIIRKIDAVVEHNGVTWFAAQSDFGAEVELWKLVPDSRPEDVLLNISTVPENTRFGSIVAKLRTSDPDPAKTYSYSLVEGPGDEANPAFRIVGDKLIVNGILDYESRPLMHIRVRVTDSAGLSTERRLNVQLSNANDRPSTIVLSENRIAENLPARSIVGNLSSEDPDPLNQFTYSLVSGIGDSDNASFMIDGSVLRTSLALQKKLTQPECHIRIRTTDQDGAFKEQRFTIRVVNQLSGTRAKEAYVIKFSETGASASVSINGAAALNQGTFRRNTLLKISSLEENDTVQIIGTDGKDVATWKDTGIFINGVQIILEGPGRLTVEGGAGDDCYRFDTDTLLGTVRLDETFGNGFDTIDFSATSELGVNLNLGAQFTQQVNANLRLRLSSSMTFESVVGGLRDDRLTGGPGDNMLNGISGNDRLSDQHGVNTLIGGPGDDWYTIGQLFSWYDSIILREGFNNGSDTLDFSNWSDGITLNLGTTEPQVLRYATSLTLNSALNFENIVGTSMNDVLYGNSSDNRIVGAAGNDILNGGKGSDCLCGGSGNDTYEFTVTRSAETDTLREKDSEGIDTITFAGIADNVHFSLASVLPQNAHANRTIRLNSAASFENLYGGSGNDELLGNSAENQIQGNSGNDRIAGGAGNDWLLGGLGNDTYVFSPASVKEYDLIDESSDGTGIDTLDFSAIRTPVSVRRSYYFSQSVHVNRMLQVVWFEFPEIIIGEQR